MTTATLPKSYMTDAEREELRRGGLSENGILLSESQAADRAGDEDTAWAWLAQARLTAKSLMTMKRVFGADLIRTTGLNTAPADAVYGAGWLDR